MALIVNRWKPDTCDCVIEYSWDDSQPAESREHIAREIVHACSAHPKEEKTAHFSKILGENTNKNKVMKKLLEAMPIEHAKLDENGQRADFVDPPEFSFDQNRKLKIKLKSSHPKSQAIKNSILADFPEAIIE
jgi:hypothetical protein